MPTKTLYYPAWISTHAGHSREALCWGKPCDTSQEAGRIGQAEVKAGNASLSFVVEFTGGEKTPLPTHVFPEAARRVVRHWEALWDATEPG